MFGFNDVYTERDASADRAYEKAMYEARRVHEIAIMPADRVFSDARNEIWKDYMKARGLSFQK